MDWKIFTIIIFTILVINISKSILQSTFLKYEFKILTVISANTSIPYLPTSPLKFNSIFLYHKKWNFFEHSYIQYIEKSLVYFPKFFPMFILLWILYGILFIVRESRFNPLWIDIHKIDSFDHTHSSVLFIQPGWVPFYFLQSFDSYIYLISVISRSLKSWQKLVFFFNLINI